MRSLLREFYKEVDDLQIEILAISQIEACGDEK